MDERKAASDTYFLALGQLDPALQLLILLLTVGLVASIVANIWLVRTMFGRLFLIIERNVKVKTALIDEFRRLRGAK